MYVITKTVTKDGREVSFDMTEIIKTWEFANEAYEDAIKTRMAQNKTSKKKVVNLGGGVLATPNGFKIEYAIMLLSKVTPESDLS